MYHGVAEEGVPFRDIAAVIGRRLFAGVDAPATSAQTQADLGWEPTQPGLLADIDQPGYYKV